MRLEIANLQSYLMDEVDDAFLENCSSGYSFKELVVLFICRVRDGGE